MNELDQFVKHKLKAKYYVRYTDDFAIVHNDIEHLKILVNTIEIFLNNRLNLKLHPDKIVVRKSSQGVDFLGYVILPNYQVVRTKTKDRAFRKMKQKIKEYKTGKITEDLLKQTLNSYLGVFSHANTYKLTQKFKNQYWFWLKE